MLAGMSLPGGNSMAERGPASIAPHAFYILLSLADEDRHGSGIAREVLDVTDGAVRLWPVKLYSTLDELAETGYIAELEGEHPEGKSRKRRYYRITDEGREALEREAERLQDLASVARARNRSGGGAATERRS